VINSNQKKCFLVVAPHPDDAELGMGGTIIKLVQMGHRVVIVDLTSGEPTPYGNEKKRKEETNRATLFLGIDERFNLGLPNRYLFDSKDARLKLAGTIRTVRPDALFCPFTEDAHPDHIASSAIAVGARFYAKYTKTAMQGEPFHPRFLFYYFCSHLRKPSNFSFLMDISEQFQKKIDAAKCYESQFIVNPKNKGVFEYVEGRDRYLGGLIGQVYAEPFYSKEALGIHDLTSFMI
jgi:bacillithiol biosynthesis deacetylase BshB1